MGERLTAKHRIALSARCDVQVTRPCASLHDGGRAAVEGRGGLHTSTTRDRGRSWVTGGGPAGAHPPSRLRGRHLLGAQPRGTQPRDCQVRPRDEARGRPVAGAVALPESFRLNYLSSYRFRPRRPHADAHGRCSATSGSAAAQAEGA